MFRKSIVCSNVLLYIVCYIFVFRFVAIIVGDACQWRQQCCWPNTHRGALCKGKINNAKAKDADREREIKSPQWWRNLKKTTTKNTPIHIMVMETYYYGKFKFFDIHNNTRWEISILVLHTRCRFIQSIGSSIEKAI